MFKCYLDELRLQGVKYKSHLLSAKHEQKHLDSTRNIKEQLFLSNYFEFPQEYNFEIVMLQNIYIWLHT
jgi:hypothetical protein